MADDDENESAPQPEENTGPKIKMGRIGKKKKKTPVGATGGQSTTTESYTKKNIGLGDGGSDIRSALGQGFNEQDIEFMKKAI